ncbi:MAG: hypothetical protein ACFFG0_42275, partial [Candidatus Thorarchaeota archaeon]
DLLTDILQRLGTVWNDEKIPQIEKNLLKERTKKGKYKIITIKKTASFPENIRTILPEEQNFKIADKMVAQVANSLRISPGKYELEEAKIKINKLIERLVGLLNSKVAKYEFTQATTLLLEKIDALINDYDKKRLEVRESFDQEIEYVREDKASRDHNFFLRHYKNYRYLIEKFVQIHPNAVGVLTIKDLKNFLAIVDRILNYYSASDIIQYDIYPTEITIDSDYLTSINYSSIDLPSMEKEYGKEQTQIDLGVIGNKKDVPNSRIPIDDYLEELDHAWQKDSGFSYRNLIVIQKLMRLWPEYNKNILEKGYYSATLTEITQVCSECIKDYNSSETEKILEFLTLKSGEILKIAGDDRPANDLPIWEYRKRLSRYSIKPLIKIGRKYFWGPHSVDRACRVWESIPFKNLLPIDMNFPSVLSVLSKGHIDMENSLEDKIKEIATRYKTNIKKNVYLHKLFPGTVDIGDVDVLVFLQEKNILLNIESKIINPAYCPKDIKRVRDKIFGRIKSDGSFEKGYLQRVEEREIFLKHNYTQIFRKLGWDAPSQQPKVISIFTTQISFWWTKFPPINTKVKFVEIKLLDSFIKGML